MSRQVRRDCGFGCVVCGDAIVQYDHVDPLFEDAHEHRPEGIALLCGKHHDARTRGLLSAETVVAARKNPITFRNGGARAAFDLTPPFTLWIGDTSTENVSCIVRTREGDRWLSVAPAEDQGAPIRIYAQFLDRSGAQSLVIDGNEWLVSSGQWDTDVVGPSIIVRRGAGDIALKLTAMPPHGLRLERLSMASEHYAIEIDPDGTVRLTRGNGVSVLQGCCIDVADAVFEV